MVWAKCRLQIGRGTAWRIVQVIIQVEIAHMTGPAMQRLWFGHFSDRANIGSCGTMSFGCAGNASGCCFICFEEGRGVFIGWSPNGERLDRIVTAGT